MFRNAIVLRAAVMGGRAPLYGRRSYATLPPPRSYPMRRQRPKPPEPSAPPVPPDAEWYLVHEESDDDDDAENRSAGGFDGRVKRTLPRLSVVNEDGYVF